MIGNVSPGSSPSIRGRVSRRQSGAREELSLLRAGRRLGLLGLRAVPSAPRVAYRGLVSDAEFASEPVLTPTASSPANVPVVVAGSGGPPTRPPTRARRGICPCRGAAVPADARWTPD